MPTPFRIRALAALILAFVVWLGACPVPAGAQDPLNPYPAVWRFLTQPAPTGVPALTVLVGGLPTDIQVPAPGSAASIRSLLSERATAADLQAAIDFHAHDSNLGDPDSIGFRLRVAVRGLMDFSTKQNGTARELNLRSRKDLAYKAVAVAAADRRDAAVTLATWAALELFRAEGGDFSPSALRARTADLAIGVDWQAVDTALGPLLGAAASDGSEGSVAGARRSIAQSITFEPAHSQGREFDPGGQGGGVEVFTWHPSNSQMNQNVNAVVVRVDMPPARVGEAPWRTVRNGLPSQAYDPLSYAAINPAGTPQEVLTLILRVAYACLGGSQENFRRELETLANGSPAKFEALRARATQAAESAACPVRLRGLALSYLAARYWSEGVRDALIRTAGVGALAAAGPAPLDTLGTGR